MDHSTESQTDRKELKKTMSPAEVWALAVGAIIGWGCFVLPGTRFLPDAGPLGTCLAFLIGGGLLCTVALCYSILIKVYPVAGGSFTYAYVGFGTRAGFICGWALVLGYLCVIAANGTALALLSRFVLPGVFDVGYLYTVAGWDVYAGELAMMSAFFIFFGYMNFRGMDMASSLQLILAFALAGGVLVLGLGCENNQVSALKEVIGQWDDERVKFLVAQEVEDEIEAGFEICRGLVEKTKADKRQPLPLAYLKVGLKCGGSDGFSGITANPLVGLFSDWLIAQGGTTVLTEVPEMFGAETILMDRAADRRVFDGTVSLINDFKRYFRRFDQPIYENPSPGNKKGGITTLEEKSLGCVQKGGAQPVVDVLTYAQPVTKPGLNLLQAPGNDLVAASALALSGCQLVLFTTGRGTPFGSFVPTMKISTNTQLAEFKANWIDFNAGTLVEDEELQAVLERFIGKVLATAGGERLKHEETGFKEIAIFKTGVTL